MFTNPFFFPYNHDGAALSLPSTLHDNSWERPTNCLVAEVIDQKVPQFEELVSNLNTAWILQKTFYITPCNNPDANNLFMIHFDSEQDLRFILENAAWVVQNKFIAIESPDKFLDNQEINVSPLTVQFRGLPEKYHHANVAKFLGDLLGETMFREDQQVNFKKEGSFLKVRVKVNIKLPLIHKLKLRVDNGNDGWIYCIYERVYRRCGRCGRIGHVRRDCKRSRDEISTALNELRKRNFEGLLEDVEIVIKDKPTVGQKQNPCKRTAGIAYVLPAEGDPYYSVIKNEPITYGENISNENDAVAVTSQIHNQVHLQIVQQHDTPPSEMPWQIQVENLHFSFQNLVAANNNQQAFIAQDFNAPWFPNQDIV